MELLTKLGIDWKLLLAQIVNFFILLLVLYKFAYRPILAMLDRRTKTIEKSLQAAKEGEEKLAKADLLREEKIAQAEKEIGKLIESARSDAEVMKKEIIATANKQAEELIKRGKLQLQEEKEKMITDSKHEVSLIVVSATSKMLQREFSPADQKRLLDAISREIKSL